VKSKSVLMLLAIVAPKRAIVVRLRLMPWLSFVGV